MVRKGPVPLRAERPIIQDRSSKDFVTLNALENIKARPPLVDQEEYWYTSKPSFGKVPGYLKHTKRQIAEEKAKMDAYLAEQVLNFGVSFEMNSDVLSLISLASHT